jgi:hypothetical protein
MFTYRDWFEGVGEGDQHGPSRVNDFKQIDPPQGAFQAEPQCHVSNINCDAHFPSRKTSSSSPSLKRARPVNIAGSSGMNIGRTDTDDRWMD